MAAKANSQLRQWAKPSIMVMRDRLRMQAGIRKRPVKWVGAELVVLVRSWVALRGIGPALAGRLGGGGAFALSREGLK